MCYSNLPAGEDQTESGIGFLIPCQQAQQVSPDGKVTLQNNQVQPLCKEPTHKAERLWHGVQMRSTLKGKSPTQRTSKGTLRWLVNPCLMFHIESKTALKVQEMSAEHSISQETKLCVYKSSAKWWKNYKTCQVWNVSFFMAFLCKRTNLLLSLVFIVAQQLCNGTSNCYHVVCERASQHLAHIRKFIMKAISYFNACGCSGYFWKVNFEVSGPKAGSVSYPSHGYTESSQKDTHWLEDQREQNWLIK